MLRVNNLSGFQGALRICLDEADRTVKGESEDAICGSSYGVAGASLDAGRSGAIGRIDRQAIYTINAIELLNSGVRKTIKKRKLFPTDDSAKKVVYLAIQDASKGGPMLIRIWNSALNRFTIEFEDRVAD